MRQGPRTDRGSPAQSVPLAPPLKHAGSGPEPRRAWLSVAQWGLTMGALPQRGGVDEAGRARAIFRGSLPSLQRGFRIPGALRPGVSSASYLA